MALIAKHMTLEDLGYNDQLEQFRISHRLEDYAIGRVVAEHKERYTVRTAALEVEAEVTGHLRFTARSREDYPAVGDWVALKTYDTSLAIIHQVLPRTSLIKRQAAGKTGEVQVIAANIDHAFLVQAVDRDFNINRLERYLTICHAANVQPVIVLTKIDLVEATSLDIIKGSIQARVKGVPVVALSNETEEGYPALEALLQKGKTYCLLGSSGVGKSTLLNHLSGSTHMRTGAISGSTSKGRHVTSHRELAVLENGSLLIDNPGMREVGLADTGSGLETTFDTITRLARSCRFSDCTHTHEAGCAVLEAVEKGTIDRASYENYLKMEREKAHYEATTLERRQKDRMFGKMMKNFKKDQKKNRY